MAISTVSPLPKSQPDISKLNTFAGYIVSVTRHLGPRGTVGTAIISSKTMTKEALLALQDQLPNLPGAGPGYYNITVSDAGGTGDDTWLVKLGPDIPQQQEYQMAGPMNGAPQNGFPGAAGPNVPMDNTAVTQILPGWYYNSQMGLLYTPWRETVTWNSGDPLPKPPAQTAAHAAFVPTATPWGQQPGQWGGYPVNDDSAAVKRLEQELVNERQKRREDDQRAATERAQAETRQLISDSNARFEKLVAMLMAKPAGDSPELAAIKAQNEQLQRQIEQDRRDAQARDRDAQTREEMRRMKEDTDRVIAAATANKSDPMLTMMMQMMSQSNASAMEAVKAIQASTSSANTSAERQVQGLVEQLRSTIISPMQMMEMMRSSRGDGAEMSKMVLETTKEMNSLQRNVFEQLLDASSQGGQPPWLMAVQSAMDKIGPIGEALANRAKQPQVIVQRVPVYTPPPPQNAALNGAPGVAPAPGPTSAQFKPGGGMPEPIVTPTEVTPGKRPEPIITPVDPVQAAPAGKKKARGKKGAVAKAPTIAEIREMDPDDVAEATDQFPEDTFFGPILSSVVQLRAEVAGGMKAEKAAEVLLQARPQLVNLEPIPPAVELLLAEQIEVLIDRVLPDASDEYREAVVAKIEEQLESEADGADE